MERHGAARGASPEVEEAVSALEAARTIPISLADQIYAELKRRILTCELAPGERLLEKNLCDTLRVSRTSLREALNRLTQEKLVVLKPNCGFSVLSMTREDFRQLCELRQVVESKVAGLAAKTSSKSDKAAS